MATAMASRFDPTNHEIVRAILSASPGVREGRMFGYPAFFVGRRMFVSMYGAGVGLKLPGEPAALAAVELGVLLPAALLEGPVISALLAAHSSVSSRHRGGGLPPLCAADPVTPASGFQRNTG